MMEHMNNRVLSQFGVLFSAWIMISSTHSISFAQTNDKPVLQSQIHQPNGVAGLDSSGSVTAPIKSSTDWIGNWQAMSTDDALARGYESALFGGTVDTGEGANTFSPRSLFIQSDPYSNYSPGCGSGVAMTGSVYSSQFPVSEGGDPRLGAPSIVAAGGFDTVANCTLLSNLPARLVLTATGYTATSVHLAAALTAAQAAQIHPGMYITTNSPNPSLNLTNKTGQLPKKNLYAGFVSKQPAAGGASINVFAWAVPGYGTGASGQVPQKTHLDRMWSAYTTPTVFLGGGAASSAFAQNWFFNIQASDLTPSSSNRSLIHQLTPLEVDLNIVNGTAPNNSIVWSGINMNAGNQPSALTKDSHQFFMGGNINHHLIINGSCGNWDLETNSVYLPTECGVQYNAYTAQISQEWDQRTNGVNNLRFVLWDAIGNASAPANWEQAIVHLGPTVDGSAAQTGDPGGSKQGDIEWNAGGNYGSVSLCGYAANCGLFVKGNGTLAVAGYATFSGGVDVSRTDMSLEGGHTLYIKPATMSSNLEAGWCATNSHTLKTCSNMRAAIALLATGDLQTSDGGSKISGLHGDGYGNWNTTTDTPRGGAMRQAAYTLSSLPTTNESDGNHLWCSDCVLNKLSGVEAYYHASTSIWTDSQNNALRK